MPPVFFAAGIVDDGKGGFGAHWMRVAAVSSRATDAYVAAKERLLSDGKSVRRVFCAPISAWECTEIENALKAGLTPCWKIPEAA